LALVVDTCIAANLTIKQNSEHLYLQLLCFSTVCWYHTHAPSANLLCPSVCDPRV